MVVPSVVFLNKESIEPHPCLYISIGAEEIRKVISCFDFKVTVFQQTSPTINKLILKICPKKKSIFHHDSLVLLPHLECKVHTGKIVAFLFIAVSPAFPGVLGTL